MAAANPLKLPIIRPRRANVIVVTGFETNLQSSEPTNACWEAVKLLPDCYTYNNVIYEIQKNCLPLEYCQVDKILQNVWMQKPELVLHVAMDSDAKCIQLGKIVHNRQFTMQDNAGVSLKNNAACLDFDRGVATTAFNVLKIVEAIESASVCKKSGFDPSTVKHGGLAQPSYDVGQYLGAYIFLRSLDVNRYRTLLLHVPSVKRFDSTKTMQIIQKVIAECMRQIKEDFVGLC